MTEKEIEEMIDAVGRASRARCAQKLLGEIAEDTSRWGRRVTAVRLGAAQVCIALLMTLPAYAAAAAWLPDCRMNTTAGLDRRTAMLVADNALTPTPCNA